MNKFDLWKYPQARLFAEFLTDEEIEKELQISTMPTGEEEVFATANALRKLIHHTSTCSEERKQRILAFLNRAEKESLEKAAQEREEQKGRE